MRNILLLAAALAATAPQAAYKCVDSKGVTHIADQVPFACDNVPVHEISRSGNVIRTISPSLTPDQVKAKNEATAKAKEDEKVAAEQKRKDLALIATYSNEKDIDLTRDRNIEPVQGRIRNAEERLRAIEKRVQELADEMEFYKAGKSKAAKRGEKETKAREVPPQLTADMDRTVAEKASLARNIAGYEREIQDIRKRYASDKARWLELKNNPTLRGQVTLPQSAAMVEANWTRGSAKCGDKVVACRRGESYYCLKGDGSWSNVPCEAPRN